MFVVYHWDLPSTLQYGGVEGWPDARIIPYFVEFAEFCFKEFGDRVKKWITFNEPWVVCYQGYEIGVSDVLRHRCTRRIKLTLASENVYITTFQ